MNEVRDARVSSILFRDGSYMRIYRREPEVTWVAWPSLLADFPACQHVSYEKAIYNLSLKGLGPMVHQLKDASHESVLNPRCSQ